MKEGYLPKDQRKNILLITDDIRLPSGVGHIGKEIVIQTAHHYNWVNLGSAINHPDVGKKFDLSEETNKEIGIEDSSCFIIPSNGYGTPDLLRHVIKEEKIDAVFIITDPRYFDWLFQIENEIRKKTPIIYLNIWDDLPAPMYNKAFYESCDALLGISKQTVNINKMVLGEKAKGKVIDYVPHGLNPKMFFPINKESEEFIKFKNEATKGKEKDFILFFNSRNIRRKSIPDALLAWKYFTDTLPKEKADKCLFILHTELISDHGTDLNAVHDYIFGEDNSTVIFSTQKLSTPQMNYFYNLADAQILLSSAEGWGLSLTEALLTGTPIIANVTGGMQDQMRFEDENGEWYTPNPDIPSNHRKTYTKCGKWAFPIFPSNLSLVGSPQTPYIWDDRCNPEDATAHLTTLYNMTSEEREKLGKEGYNWAHSEEAGFTSPQMAKRVMDSVDKLFNTWHPRLNYELINANEVEENRVPHKLLY
tara:strand:- start:1035 stop:2465 length:1431 start_codon:yes stop_codon:yes gene_type:complete